MGAAQFARDELAHALDAVGRRRILLQKLLGEPHGAERHADRFLDAFVLGERDLAAAAAEIDEEHAAADAGLCLHDAAMNEAALFEARR